MDLPPIKGKKWLLKPNILTGALPEEGVTTHPEILRGVIRYLKDRGGVVGVGDSPGVGPGEAAAEKAGLMAVIRDEGAQWVPFTKSRRHSDFGGKLIKSFDLTDALDEWDYLINLPKMKNHQMMFFTGAMKNIFGLIPGLAKSQFHFRFTEKEDFAQMIVDLNRAVQPVFSLMDGIVSMEGHGPRSGKPCPTGYLLASKNPLALDCAAQELLGYNSLEMPISRRALKEGFRDTRLATLTVKNGAGALLELSRIPRRPFKKIEVLKSTGFLKKKLPPGLYRFLKNLYLPRPRFSRKKCISCGKCVAICPVNALTLNPITVDYKKCIRCYCCHEVCPADAISISRIPW